MRKIFVIAMLALLAPQYLYAAQQTWSAGDPLSEIRVKTQANDTELYGQAATKWVTATAYTANNQMVTHGGHVFICISNHTAGASTEPGVGASWATVWRYHGADLYEPLKGTDDNYVTDAEKARLGDLEATDNVSFGNVTATGGALYAGVANTTGGALVLYTNTDPIYTAGWLPAATPTGSVTLRFPPAAAGGNNYLLNFDADGTGGFTDPATFTDDQTAAEVPFTPEGSISAITVQAAIQEVRDEAGGGSMTWPSTAGIPYWTSGTAWGGAYNATTKIPADYVSTLNQNTTGTAGGLSGTPNITVGTISAGTAGFTVDADGDATAKSYSTTFVDGAMYSELPINTAANPYVPGVSAKLIKIFNNDGVPKLSISDSVYTMLTSNNLDDTPADDDTANAPTSNALVDGLAGKQAADADLTDLADGSLTASKVAGSAVATGSKATTYTIGTDSADESYGGTIYVTSATTITAPAVVAGMNFTVVTIGDIAVSLDLNAADKMVLDGVTLADGDKATNSSKSGDTITCQYYSADGFYCWSGTVLGGHWTDGN